MGAVYKNVSTCAWIIMSYCWNEKACGVHFIPLFHFVPASMKKTVPKDGSVITAMAVTSLNPFPVLQQKLHGDLRSKMIYQLSHLGGARARAGMRPAKSTPCKSHSSADPLACPWGWVLSEILLLRCLADLTNSGPGLGSYFSFVKTKGKGSLNGKKKILF